MNTKTQIGLLVIVSFMAWIMYQNMVVIPESKIAYERKLQQDKETNYRVCDLNADINYMNDWNSQCSALDKKDNCLLPKYLADDLKDSQELEKKNCVTMYK